MKFFFILMITLLSLPGFSQEDDDKLLEDLEEDRKKQVELAVKMNEARENLQNSALNAPEQLRKLGYDKIDAAALMDEKVVKVLKNALDQSPLKNAPAEEVRMLILERARGNPVGNYLEDHPKVLNALVDVLRDEKALSSAVGIFLRKKDMKIYFGIWVALMIFAWLFKKIFFDKRWSRGKTFLMSLLVSICVTTLSLTTFYKMFNKELSPTTKILIKHWRKRNLKT